MALGGCVLLFMIPYLLILEREVCWGREGKRQRERNIDLLSYLLMHSWVNSCMCPDYESNPQPWQARAKNPVF